MKDRDHYTNGQIFHTTTYEQVITNLYNDLDKVLVKELCITLEVCLDLFEHLRQPMCRLVKRGKTTASIKEVYRQEFNNKIKEMI